MNDGWIILLDFFYNEKFVRNTATEVRGAVVIAINGGWMIPWYFF